MPRARRPKVSVCIIARDEARVLPRCLASLRGAYDELCVLDTGSADATPQVAKEFGARLAVFKGCNDAEGRMADFALARNTCLRMARGDWILSIDADEVLLKSSVERVRWHAEHDDSAAVRINMRFRGSEWPVIRLFRRSPENVFVGRVHEWVSVEGEVSEDPAIVIRNLPNKRGKESAVERDLRLCALTLEDEPGNLRMIFYMARALRRAGDYDAAIRHYERYLEVEKEFRPGRHACAHGIAVCHLLSGRWRRAVSAGKAAVAIDPRLAESHCLVADAYMALARHDLAVRWYQSALRCKEPPPDYTMFVDRSSYSTYPLRQLRRFEITLG